MSDSAAIEGHQYLWVLFLSLFLILFSISAFVLCHQTCGFCERYCIFQWKCGWCCIVDMEGYRTERQHLQHLRELRQRRELEIAHLATFTQIPGPIPDSYGFRGLHRQTAIRDFSSWGFIVVTPPHHHHHHSQHQQDVHSLQMRNQLSHEQRRDILDRLLSCRVCAVNESVVVELFCGILLLILTISCLFITADVSCGRAGCYAAWKE